MDRRAVELGSRTALGALIGSRVWVFLCCETCETPAKEAAWNFAPSASPWDLGLGETTWSVQDGAVNMRLGSSSRRHEAASLNQHNACAAMME